MRAGSMDRTITVQRGGKTRDAYGGASTGWTNLATVRAQLLASSTAEFMEAAGEQTERLVAFRIRWMEGFRNADRIVFDGSNYDVIEIKEIGRRRGLELRCKGAAS